MSDLQTLRGWVRDAHRIVLLTGAGMSAESGVPTFRDAQTGLWAEFDPQQLATEAAFRKNPRLVWDWYTMRREMVGKVAPNAGHLAIAQFQQRHPGRLTLVTQNVDGLHQRAGSADTIALHGTLAKDQWLDTPRICCNMDTVSEGHPPYCGVCGNMLRPAVVWFGESLPPHALARAEEAADTSDLLLVVGTSGVVYPAAGLAHRVEGRVVIVNPESSGLDAVATLVVRGTAATVLPGVLPD